MTQSRKIKDGIANFFTYLASSATFLILIAIFAFVIATGKDTLSMEMLRNDYWSQNYLVEWTDQTQQTFTKPDHLGDEVVYSTKYGIGFTNEINHEKQRLIRVSYIDDDSVFNQSVNATKGPSYGESLTVSIGDQIEKIEGVNATGTTILMGTTFADKAESMVMKLDSTESLTSLYYKTPGGGIWGSLLATLMLIGISLLFALPIGIFAAIYLTEIAQPSKFNSFIERCIEMLAGVPSIIFGLMGIVVLYPITAFFNISGLSILLGGMTMSVMLLPVIIRSVQESLIVVPRDYRSASLSLGASQTQTIFRVILPSALPGILSAILLAVSRIIGESAALIYTMGTFINDAPRVGEGATTLAVHIWSVMSHEQPNFELASAVSIIILALVLVLNLSVKLMSRRLNKKLGA